jgi:hypothetical protein
MISIGASHGAIFAESVSVIFYNMWSKYVHADKRQQQQVFYKSCW